MSDGWFRGIRNIIIERGESYYFLDRVKNITKVDDNYYEAEVIGSGTTYHTSVELIGDKLISSSCDCPYDSGVCKHVAALLFALENEEDSNTDNSEEKTTSINFYESESNEQKLTHNILNLLNKLDFDSLLQFTKKYIKFDSIKTIYEMENDLKHILKEPPFFNKELYLSYLSDLDKIDNGDVYIEIEESYEDYGYYDDYQENEITDNGIRKQLTSIIFYIHKLYDEEFFEQAKVLIRRLFTLTVYCYVNQEDMVSKDISSLSLPNFNEKDFLNMYLDCVKHVQDESIVNIISLLESCSIDSDIINRIKELYDLKDILNYDMNNESYRSIVHNYFSAFIDFFKTDYPYFKSLLELELTGSHYHYLIDQFTKFLDSIDINKLEETVNYFIDVIQKYEKHNNVDQIYFKIYSLYKTHNIEYSYYLFKAYELFPTFERFLLMYTDNHTFFKYQNKIENIALKDRDNIISFLLNKITYNDIIANISKINDKIESIFTYLALILLVNIDTSTLIKYPSIIKILKVITKENDDSYLDAYEKLKETFLYCHTEKYDNLTLKDVYEKLIDIVKEITVRAFIPNQFWGRTFAINALWVMDNLAVILNFECQYLYFYYKDKYKRYKEFRN